MSPKRIQRQRVKGWRMPENTVYVGRPTVFGNPVRVERADYPGRWDVWASDIGPRLMTEGSHEAAQRYAVDVFENWINGFQLLGNPVHPRQTVLGRLDELRGKDLACWCSLADPCHADVLLELANR